MQSCVVSCFPVPKEIPGSISIRNLSLSSSFNSSQVGKQADFVQQETKSFLDRVYRGSFGEMLTTMVKQEQLSEQDLKQLRQLLEETEEKG